MQYAAGFTGTGKPMIAPSILSANFVQLGTEIASIVGSDWVHVDVMDNHFVPNLTLGPPVVQSLVAATDLPLDCHLMIDDPDQWAPGYAELGAHNVTFHVEAATDPRATARNIKAAGATAGLALKPGTALEDYFGLLSDFDTLLIMTVEPGFGGQDFMTSMLSKIAAARRAVDAGHLHLLVEIDGGVNEETIERAAMAGADCFVAGSAVFGASDPSAAIARLRNLAQAASA